VQPQYNYFNFLKLWEKSRKPKNPRSKNPLCSASDCKKLSIEAVKFGLKQTINLFGEFAELLVIVPPNEHGENTDAYGQVTWLIRLSDIIALAYPTEYWSKDRLESLLPPDAVTYEVGD
jgi:hypothetical protein